MTKIEEAIKYVVDRTIITALEESKLNIKTINVVKDTKKWLNCFKRVGDLLIYLNKFNETPGNSPVYDDLVANGVDTFEDILEDFNKRFGRWKHDFTTYSDFIVGKEYSSHDILIFVRHYNTQAGGMFVMSNGDEHESVVIKATINGLRYPNKWIVDQQVLKYYLKARKGDFGEHYAPNEAILHNPDKPIYVFMRHLDKGPFIFEGIFLYGSIHRETDGSKWFELNKSEMESEPIIELASHLQERTDKKIAKSRKDTPEQRADRLENAEKKPKQVVTHSISYVRNTDVIVEVLNRAAGYCEACKEAAPFISASTGCPYLEVHHVIRLADEGEDTIDNALALCPNCHRKAHYGKT